LIDAAALEQRLRDALERHGVAGAALGVRIGDESVFATAGAASVRTGAPVTPDSLFALGSVTKIYQAALLVSLGLDLDAPVQRFLPGFRVADADASAAITLRHLLTHASGIGGDYVPDFGWGDDAVTRYVEGCAQLPQEFPPGLLTSYCNSAVVIGGRVVEVQTGTTWDQALRDRLLGPAGLEHTRSLPWEAILYDCAVGHVTGAEGPEVAPTWSWGRAFGPCGGTPAASIRDLVAFGGLFVDEAAPVGAEVAARMAELQRPWPEGIDPGLEGMGLGWFLFDLQGTRLLSHDGAGLGCSATLRVIPEHGAVVAGLANTWYGGFPLTNELMRDVIADELGLRAEELPAHTANPHPASRYAGSYARLRIDLELSAGADGTLAARETTDGLGVHADTVREFALEPIGPDRFRAAADPMTGSEPVYLFLDTDGDGAVDYLQQDTAVLRKA
jgi:CubicO group peptidase (beta-lactamase class C family)